MATSRQVVEILDRVLRVPEGTSNHFCRHLRSAGLIQSTQGVPARLPSDEAALVLLAVLIGPAATSEPTLVRQYADMRPITGGRNLGNSLADYLDGEPGFVELNVSLWAPFGSLTYTKPDGAVAVDSYYAVNTAVPAFSRSSKITAETLREISAAIKAAPPVKVGPRRAVQRHIALERAALFH